MGQPRLEEFEADLSQLELPAPAAANDGGGKSDRANAARASAAGVVCNRCGSAIFVRSRIRWYEAWRRTLPKRPFRCQTCHHRIWFRPERSQDTPHVNAAADHSAAPAR